MVERFIKALKHTRYALLGGSFALAVTAAGVVMFTQPNVTHTAAASCDKVNIVDCGFNGPDAQSYIQSFKHFYNTGSDGRFNDLKAVYRWSGATDFKMANMDTSNTKMGTMYRNGDIKVDGKVVGHDAWVAARFGAGQPGFVHVEGNVWARKTTTSLAEASTPVLVHFDGASGQADFAAMVNCGNAVKMTPVKPPKPKPQPKPQLACQNLTFAPVANKQRDFTFTAKASAQNTTITSYHFDFGDGGSVNKMTSQSTATAEHQYAAAGKTFTARVSVNSKDLKNVTSRNCVVTVKTETPPPPPPPTKKPELTCDSLQAAAGSEQGNFGFIANATAKNTTISSFVFDFGDGKKQTINTTQNTATTNHTYSGQGQSFTAKVTVNSLDVKNVTSPSCQVTVKTQTPPPPPPPTKKPELTCDSLTMSIVPDQDNTFNFVAKATATNTTITNYVFDFGDGSDQQTITTSENSANAEHTYDQADAQFTAMVTVNSTDVQDVTSPKCQVTVKTPPTPVSPQLVCQELTFQPVAGQANTFTFTATANASNTTITNFIFDFGDGSDKQTVTTDQTSAQATHTYPNSDQDFTASVVVNSQDLQNVTSSTCQVTVPHQQAVLGTTTTTPPAPPELPNTGAGAVIGLFGATTVAGALFHRLFFRRRYN